MHKKLFIPTKIKVGFQKRSGTFTGMLAYVIYFDEKNVLRKAISWERWRDKSIEPIELDNIPQNGFVLNKGIQRHSDWGSNRSVIRVHDSRNFEFEISINNLIGILMHSNVSKRDIMEDCVYAWTGSELVLLPVNSDAYRDSVEYTNKQEKKVYTKDLVKGRQYIFKKQNDIVTYIGYYDKWELINDGYDINSKSKRKKHIFHSNTKGFVDLSTTVLSHQISDDIVENYAFLVDEFFDSHHSQPLQDIKIVPLTQADINKYISTDANVYLSKIENNKLYSVRWYNYSFRQLMSLNNVYMRSFNITNNSTPEVKACSNGHYEDNRISFTRIDYGNRSLNYEQKSIIEIIHYYQDMNYGKAIGILKNGKEIELNI
ncbi:MAG: hypothetical protein ACXW2E_00550 [Nitrososphaeraceae archaeon]